MYSMSRTPSKIRARRDRMSDSTLHIQEIPVRDTGGLEFSSASGHTLKVNKKNVMYEDSRMAIIDKRRLSEPTISENSRRTASGAIASKARGTSQDGLTQSTSYTTSKNVELSNFLYNLWRNQEMCDIVIRVGGAEYKAHKLALAAHSEKFTSRYCERLPTSISEVNLSSSSREAVEDVLNYIYTNDLNITRDNVDAVIGCARQLGILSALDICKKFLLDFTPDTLFTMWWIARKHDLLDVVSTLEGCVCNHFSEVYKSLGYLHGHFEQIRHFICKDNLRVEDELEVFLAVVSWIDFNRQDRLRHAKDLLTCVRFNFISPADLASHVEVIDYLFQIPECKDLLLAAYRYHALHLSGSDLVDSTSCPSRRTVICKKQEKTCDRNLCQNNSFTLKPHQSPVRTTQSDSSKSYESSSGASSLPLPLRPTTLLAVGGVDPFDTEADVACRMVEQYNPVSNSWHPITNLPETRHHLGVAVLDRHLYVIGGSVLTRDDMENLANPTDVNFRYDPFGNIWSRIACLRQPRMYLSVCVLEGILYAIGGNDTYGRSLDSVEYYDPDNDHWGFIAPMSIPKIGVASAGLQGLLYVVGGFQDTDKQKVVLDNVECYDPRRNSWISRNPLPVPCCHANLVEVRGSLFLLGGSTISEGSGCISSLPSVYRYSEDEDIWDLVASMRVPRHDAGAAVIGSRIYVVGGVSSDEGKALMDIECLDVDLMTWIDGLEPLEHAALGIACCTFSGDDVIG